MEHPVKSIILINPQSWSIINLMLPYVVMNAQAHHVINLFSHEDSNSDIQCAHVKEDVHIETSSPPHFHLCPNIHNASTYRGDAPCSLASSSDELSPQLTQDGEAFHDKIENILITQDSSHPSSSLMLHEDNSSNKLAHSSSPIHLSLDVPSEEPTQLSNLIVVETCDKYRCHQESGFEISSNHPQAMHDLVQA